jgi:prepilin-type N-terminal cleavage/methylation domain-containing protein
MHPPPDKPGKATLTAGFTLIEMSIVLVIIGLIAGGIVVGQNLIAAAGVRATLTQIEKYNQAANTFRETTGYLPGDIPAVPAAQLGLTARGSLRGQGDGNGVIEGSVTGSASPGLVEGMGETALFWSDLSAMHFVDGTYNAATAASFCDCMPSLKGYFPNAAIGRHNQVYVWSGGEGNGTSTGNNGINYLSIAVFQYIWNGGLIGTAAGFPPLPGLTVAEAQGIDSKIDDGFPQSGRVTAVYDLENTAAWAGTFNPVSGTSVWGKVSYTSATPGSATSCFDNSSAASGSPGVAGSAQHYSMEMNNGAGLNCALSFQMQAGD